MQGVILAAGRGKRLGPLTTGRSKAMLPIAGQPMIERVVHVLKSAGVEDLILVIQPDDQEIREAYAGRARFAVQPEPVGMANALLCAAPLLETDFILSACDNLVPVEYVSKMMARWNAGPRPNALLSLLPLEPNRLGSVALVEVQGEWVTRIQEKPAMTRQSSRISSLPMYVFSQRLLEYLPHVTVSERGEYELQDAIQMLIERDGRVGGIQTSWRMTLTDPTDLLALNRYFLNHEPQPDLPSSPTARFIPPVLFEPGVQIDEPAEVGPEVYAEGGSRIGAGAVVRQTVLLRGAVVRPGQKVEGQVIGA